MNKNFHKMLWTVCLLTLILVGATNAQDKADKIHREIYVPFDDLNVLLAANSDRVLLSRAEYEQLLEFSKTRTISRAPEDSVVVAANYKGTVRDGITTIVGTLIVESLNDGLVQIPLSIGGVAIRKATLGDEPANLWRDSKGRIWLLVAGKARKTLTIEMTVPMETTAARQSMSLQLPAPSATQIELTVPGNVDVKSGMSVVKREYNEAENMTKFDLLPTKGPMSLVLSLNNRLLKDDRVVVSHSVLIHKLTPDTHEMHLTGSMDVIHGAIETLRFSVPEGYQISSVATELLNQWEIETDESGNDVLNILLRVPTREDVVVHIVASRDSTNISPWNAPQLRPLDVAGSISVVGVLADISLKAEKVETTGVTPIDHEFLSRAIPATLTSNQFANPVSIVAAYYAPQTDYEINTQFVQPAPELLVTSNARLDLSDKQLELRGGVSLASLYDTRFDVDLTLPVGWRFTEITGEDGQPIKFERYPQADKSRIKCRLGKRIKDEPTRIYFVAQSIPEGWIESWSDKTIAFPAMTVEGATRHTGAIAVTTSPDLVAKPTDIRALDTLGEKEKPNFNFRPDEAPLAFHFKSADFGLTLNIHRLEPILTARTFTFFEIAPNQLRVRNEILFEIRQAKTDLLKFQLPISTPESISIRGHNVELKDFFSDSDESSRNWTVQLADKRLGQVRLLADYYLTIDEAQLANLTLRPITASDVQFQSAMVSVEGNSELDIQIETQGRSIDVGELEEAIYQPGRYLLGAYSWTSDSGEMTVKCSRRPIYGLPSAIVQRAEMITAISSDGRSQTAARFQLVTNQPFVRIQLPGEATLWSVLLDGQPAKPQRDQDSLIVSLATKSTGKVRDLQLVYESSIRSFGFVGHFETEAPKLGLFTTKNDEFTVPLVDLKWRLSLPDGYEVCSTNDAFQSDQINKPPLIERLGYWINAIGGGIEDGFLDGQSVNWTGGMQVNSAQSRPTFAAKNMAPVDGRFDDAPARSAPVTATPDQNAIRVNRGGAEAEISAGLDEAKGERDSQTVDAEERKPLPKTATAVDSPAQEAKRQTKMSLWALQGLRSLKIQLTETDNSIDLLSLGEQPELQANVSNQNRIQWLAMAIALLIGFIGITLTRRSVGTKFLFLALVVLAACLLPVAGSWFDAFYPIVDFAVLSAVLVAIYFLVAAILQRVSNSANFVVKHLPIVLVGFLLSMGSSDVSLAQTNDNSQADDSHVVVKDLNELKQLLDRLRRESKPRIPKDAIIIPFDVNDPAGQKNADQLLIPYEDYLRLTEQADPNTGDKPKIDSPVDFVLSAAEYSLQLALDADLTIQGRLVFELLQDTSVSIPLPIDGGALSTATVDGQPAKLQFVSLPPTNAKGRGQAKKGAAQKPSNAIMLYLEGKGKKVFEFNVQVKPNRQGGWRSLNVRLPVGLTRSLDIRSTDEPVEIRLNSDADRRSIEAKPGETVSTILSADGTLRLQWKPSTAVQAIDQSLTVDSEAVFDIREDGLRLSWRFDLDFRGSELDAFSLQVPNGYLVERVTGENVRAWDVKPGANWQELVVTVLSTAKNTETFTVHLSKRDFSISQEVQKFSAPYLSVEGSALQKGTYTIRRSPIVELKQLRTHAASRIDNDQLECKIDMDVIDANSSPLGIKEFQVLQFVTTPFQIELEASELPQQIKAETQTVLRMGQSEADFELQIAYDLGKRPVYELSFDLPATLTIDELTANSDETWSIERIGDVQRVHVFFSRGITGKTPLLVNGTIQNYEGQTSWSIPKIMINDVDTQTGQFAIQVDPALNVTAVNLKNCQSVLVRQLTPWLNPDQRSLTRQSLQYRDADYAATLRFSKIQPQVSVETITNVRTTYFAVEETILLDFDIQRAGIRQIRFLLPERMRNSKIVARFVSEKTTALADAAHPGMVQVQLDLQDDVIGSYRIIIENDRQLGTNEQRVPMPVVLTGEVGRQYATIQNAGRDEVTVAASDDFTRLNRELSQYADLTQKLAGGELTMAYVAKRDVENPNLAFQTTARQTVETVSASIEFSKTTMVVDSSGAYRALQNFQVNNRSEQYLDVELPNGSRLLTVMVQGYPVKPVQSPTGTDRQLRIPLVKTPEGDLDYSVQLKYGGKLGELRTWKSVDFPVIETININVQLSQLHLLLPESHKWFKFGGTMTQVDSKGELDEGFLSYKARQIQQLTEQLRFESSELGGGSGGFSKRGKDYSKFRALGNLDRLQSEMQEFEEQSGQIAFQSQLEFNKKAIETAKQSAAAQILYSQSREQQQGQQLTKSAQLFGDNRANLNVLLENQKAEIARNSVTRGLKNFGYEVQTVEDQEGQVNEQGGEKFDAEWFSRNQLYLQKEDKKSKNADQSRRSSERGEEEAVKIVQNKQLVIDDSIRFANPQLANQPQGGQDESDAAPGDPFAESGRRSGETAVAGVPSAGRQVDEIARQDVEYAAPLSSLDIELPTRGVSYFFKSPRGNSTVTAHPIVDQTFSRWLTVGLALLICVLAWIVYRCFQALNKSSNLLRTIGFLLLGLVGFVSMLTLTLPVYGILLLLLSILMLGEHWTSIANVRTSNE